jgi:hypothetical protein
VERLQVEVVEARASVETMVLPCNIVGGARGEHISEQRLSPRGE